jgi:NAD(P)H-dependent FMN reductase
MKHAPKVVAVCGSLRDASHTRKTLRHVLAAAEDAGAETQLLDLTEWDLPLFDPNYDEQGDSEEIKKITREADAIVLGSPVYHGSYSSALKSYMDYCSFDEFEDTTVGLVAIAGGGTFGPTLEHMRAVCRGVHAWVLPRQVGVRNAYDAFDDEGEFEDRGIAERVETLGREIVEYATIAPEKLPAQGERSACADDQSTCADD